MTRTLHRGRRGEVHSSSDLGSGESAPLNRRTSGEKIDRHPRAGAADSLATTPATNQTSENATGERVQVAVLGGFKFWEGGDALVTLSAGPQRLLALLALNAHGTSRTEAAGTLWPESSDDRALASLRSLLGRLDATARRGIVANLTDICLTEGVTVDIREARALANRLLTSPGRLDYADTNPAAVASLSTPLLPGWYDDWVIVQAEDWRQLRLHALEALAGHLTAAGRYGEAATSAIAAVRAEPLRESSHGALIRVHLAEGNQTEALSEYQSYRRLLHTELGLEPTAKLRDLVGKLLDP